MENAAGGSAKNFKGGAGERCGEREGIGSEGDALSCGVGGAGIEVGGTGKLVEGVIPEDFACGGVTIHETCSFEGRNPESGSGSCSFPDEGAAGTEGGGGEDRRTGDGADDFESFCGRRGADTNRGIEDVEFVGGLIVEFESACGGRETEEGVVGHDEVARDGNVSGDGFAEVEECAIGAGDVSTEDREIGADRCGGFNGEGTGRTELVLRMEDTTRGGADDFEGGAGEGGGEREGIGSEGDALSCGVGGAGIEIGGTGKLVEGVIPEDFACGGVTIRETCSFEGRNPESGSGSCSFPDEGAAGTEGGGGEDRRTGDGADDFESFCGRRGADTNRGIEDVEFVGGLIVEFESACGGRETEEGVVGHDEVARDGNVSGDGFAEVEECAIGAGDVAAEDREIGADGGGGFNSEGT